MESPPLRHWRARLRHSGEEAVMKKKKARAKAAKKTKARKVVKSKAKKSSAKRSPTKRSPTKAAKKAKKTKKKAAAPPKPGVIAPVNGVLLGFVEDFFAKIGVIALTLKAPVAVGQKI